MSHSLFPTYFRESQERTGWVLEMCRRGLITLGFVSDTDADSSSEHTFLSALLEQGLTSHSVRSSIRARDESSIYHPLTFSNFRVKTKRMKGQSVRYSHMIHMEWSDRLQDMLKWKRMLDKSRKFPRGMFLMKNWSEFFQWSCMNTEHLTQAMKLTCGTWSRCVRRTCSNYGSKNERTDGITEPSCRSNNFVWLIIRDRSVKAWILSLWQLRYLNFQAHPVSSKPLQWMCLHNPAACA